MILLRFINKDARPKVAEILCDHESIALVMRWYGSFYAGDRYEVYADGVKLAKDQNGELVTPAGAPTMTPPGEAMSQSCRTCVHYDLDAA